MMDTNNLRYVGDSFGRSVINVYLVLTLGSSTKISEMSSIKRIIEVVAITVALDFIEYSKDDKDYYSAKCEYLNICSLIVMR